MLDQLQTILAKKPAVAALAVVLFAGFTAPFVALQQFAHADPAPLDCTEGNHNGCTELSPVPPEDPKAVPPNIMLMLDDSGSMQWDFMPDWNDIKHGSWTTSYSTGEDDLVADSRNNGLWYDPTVTYALPPTANGGTYAAPTSMATSWNDGFTKSGSTDPAWLTRNSTGAFPGPIHYNRNLVGASSATVTAPATYQCPSGFKEDPDNPDNCISTKVAAPATTQPATQKWVCNKGGSGPAAGDQGANTCTITTVSGEVTTVTTYAAVQQWVCSSGTLDASVDPPICKIAAVIPPKDKPKAWLCPSGYNGPAAGDQGDHTCTKPGQPGTIGAFVYIDPRDGQPHFITSNGSHGDCDGVVDGGTANYPDAKANCVKWDDTSGKGAPAGVQAGTNVSIWYSFYRTRILMAKSGLMTAFAQIDPKYRVGFGSINATAQSTLTGLKIKGTSLTAIPTYTFDDATSGGGRSDNKLAAVQPFGDGSANTQKANFWTWIAKVAPANQTPLRKALQGVGEYYKTAQPWTAMSGDPGYTTGSTTKFACRASYTILTTDGFWNGADPSDIGAAANTDGPVQTVPAEAVTQYTAVDPYKGGSVGGGVASLADVATYYWENDLNTDLVNEVSTSAADPASWQHMTTFTVGMGYDPVGITPSTAKMTDVFAWARGSGAPITGFGWPTPASGSLNNIADLAHAAVNGHGDFFNAHNPQQLAAAFSKALTDIAARTVAPSPATVNASVLAVGSLTFGTGYDTGKWGGTMQAVTLKTDGTVGGTLWKAGQQLDLAYHSQTGYAARTVYTGAYNPAGTGTYSTFQFNAANKASLDATETAGLQTPALAGGDDTLDNRISYLLGDSTYEEVTTGTVYRARDSILGAIIRSDPVYIAGANGGYRDSWPLLSDGTAPAESESTAQTYSAFIVQESTRPATVYVGANDGMLHAFYAPVPTCSGTVDASGNCSAFTSAAGAGKEMWAFVPRAVYANLGNLTDATNFTFLPTVDATPVTRDVFSSADKKWHTLLAGGVGLGGRGVYGIDVTHPDPTDADNPFTASKVLWEFDSDMAVPTGCVATFESCRGTDLGFTMSQPNIGRLASGKWVVLVPNGYFPDCKTPDFPTKDVDSCQAIASQVPRDSSGKPYSALFVLDAISGKMIAELKTPTNIAGVTSFGLATPVLGDYNSDQVDDVAFAGDVQGNLWRFDLSDPTPSNWSVTLVYKGLANAAGQQGQQPITTMPRLFPDPTTNRFIVVFGTGKYLGVGDNSITTQQGLYGVRDVAGTTYTQANLTQQYLHETIAPSGDPNAGASLRCITGGATDSCTADATPINALPVTGGGWYVNLYTTTAAGVMNDAGERVVVNPAAVFASNTVVFQSLITGAESIDACNPSTQGAVMALSATSGGPAGVSSLGPWPVAGGRIINARTRGSLPLVSPVAGGKAYLPTALLYPSGTSPVSIDAPIPRRRSWRELLNGQ